MKTIFSCLLILILTSCKSNDINLIDLAPQYAGTHGYVYTNSDPIEVTSLKTNKKYKLRYQNNNGIRSEGAWLPEGEYTLSKWHKYKVTGYDTFSVKAGFITNLGDFLWIDIGENKLIALPHIPSYGDKGLTSIANSLSHNLISKEPINWVIKTIPPPIKQTAETYGAGLLISALISYEFNSNASVKLSSIDEIDTPSKLYQFALENAKPTSGEPAIDEMGALYYAAEFGQLRKRNNLGTWHSIDTQSLSRIESVEYVNDTLIIGSVTGEIKTSQDKGKSWITVHEFSDGESVYDIDKSDNGIYILTKKYISSINVYYASTTNLEDLSLIYSAEYDSDHNSPSFFPIKGQTIGNDYLLGNYPHLLRWNYNDKVWNQIPLPTDINSFNLSNDGSTLTVLNPNMFWGKLFTSTDYGQNWTELKKPKHMPLYVNLDNPNTGIAMKVLDVDIKGYGSYIASHEFLKLNSNRKTWPSYAEPAKCYRILFNENNKPKYCVTLHGSILGLIDGKWKVEVLVK